MAAVMRCLPQSYGDVLTHESDRAWDYAYGVPHCKDLAAGTRLDKRCAEDKKNGPPALCPASYSFQNAESLAFVPAGKSQALQQDILP